MELDSSTSYIPLAGAIKEYIIESLFRKFVIFSLFITILNPKVYLIFSFKLIFISLTMSNENS